MSWARSATEILRDLRLTMKSSAPGRYYTTCPQCSDRRKKANQKLACLGVTIDATGVGWRCQHCDWSGLRRYEPLTANQKVRGASSRKNRDLGLRLASSGNVGVDDRERIRLALAIWNDAHDARGTLAWRYLERRGVNPSELLDVMEALRFYSACPFAGEHLACMVALYRDIHTDEPKAIHRTALTPHGEKIDRKALGPKGGCAIKLSANENVTQGLTIGEGIETTLAGVTFGFRPAWALGDANQLARFPVLPGVEALTILVDHDESGRGQGAAIECSRRWTEAAREVFRVVPNTVGADMADIVHENATL